MRPSKEPPHAHGAAGSNHTAAPFAATGHRSSPAPPAPSASNNGHPSDASDSTPLLAGEDSKDHHHSHAHLHPLHDTKRDAPSSSSSSSSSSFSSSSDLASFLDRYFCISARSSTIATEVRAGVVTFATMAYILIVNAEILSNAKTPSLPGMDYDGIVLATAISAAVGSGMVGVWGNLPFGLAAGMGLNSYFTYAVVIQLNQPYQVALTASFIHGLLFALLSMLGACNLIQQHAPTNLKKSITVGLGLFQAILGYQGMGLVTQGKDTLLQLGDITSPTLWLSLSGLILIALLIIFRVKAAMLVGMAIITCIAWTTRLQPLPKALIQWPSLGNAYLSLDFAAYWNSIGVMLPVSLVFLFVSVFDTAGVQGTAAQQAGLLNAEGHLPAKASTAAFASAAVATCVGSLLGSSPIIIHTESGAGIADGARTGLSSVVVAVLFLLFIPFVPILHAIPPLVTAPALVIVGSAMMGVSKFIDWQRMDEALPAFLTCTLIAFTYSIANGVLAGMLAYALLKGAAVMAGVEKGDEEEEEEEEEEVKGVRGEEVGGGGGGGRRPTLERRKSGSMLETTYAESPAQRPSATRITRQGSRETARYGAVDRHDADARGVV